MISFSHRQKGLGIDIIPVRDEESKTENVNYLAQVYAPG